MYCKNGLVLWTHIDNIKKNKELVYKYKVFISKSAGDPTSDRNVIGKPYVADCNSACTDSLIPVGEFDNETEAINLAKYMKTRFLRYLVSILKTSQNVTQIVYRFVPLQDFTDKSDIDWSKSIEEIDEKLYEKYDLKQESDFIKSMIKPMQ